MQACAVSQPRTSHVQALASLPVASRGWHVPPSARTFSAYRRSASGFANQLSKQLFASGAGTFSRLAWVATSYIANQTSLTKSSPGSAIVYTA